MKRICGKVFHSEYFQKLHLHLSKHRLEVQCHVSTGSTVNASHFLYSVKMDLLDRKGPDFAALQETKTKI